MKTLNMHQNTTTCEGGVLMCVLFLYDAKNILGLYIYTKVEE
jgi:hypothetical protein